MANRKGYSLLGIVSLILTAVIAFTVLHVSFATPITIGLWLSIGIIFLFTTIILLVLSFIYERFIHPPPSKKSRQLQKEEMEKDFEEMSADMKKKGS